MIQTIGKVTLDFTYYQGTDLYNEGDEVEEKVLETVQNETDYVETLSKDTRWPILYQLSKERENIIEPLDIRKTDTVLEVGAGMGAVTGAIARRCKRVDCIDLSKRRSLANAYRNREYENIHIIVGNYQDVKLTEQYDVITLIGVFEYAQWYIEGKHPYAAFLKQLAGQLKPNGRLYIAIENKLGIKYFAGCVEDHLGEPFRGIEGYNASQKVRTFTHSELEKLIVENGFKEPYFYYPFPDYKLPNVIFSDDYLPDSSFNATTYLNYDMDRWKCFDEQKALLSLIGTEEIKTFSNSFLIEAIRK
ncbi:MAG: class I SAM-dependent methyltransferase [Ruthenibacterium sp.]